MINNQFNSFSNYNTSEFPQMNPMSGLANPLVVRSLSAPIVPVVPVPSVIPAIPCFKHDTKILCLVDGEEVYVKIQDMRPGVLVRTVQHGYVPLEVIGKKPLKKPEHNARIPNRMYKYTSAEYPEIIEDLYITGHHCILLSFITEEQREEVWDLYQDIYITEEKFRYPCFLDPKAQISDEESESMIYHFALENDDIYANYGVLANGLLVETCSIRYLKELSKMDLIL